MTPARGIGLDDQNQSKAAPWVVCVPIRPSDKHAHITRSNVPPTLAQRAAGPHSKRGGRPAGCLRRRHHSSVQSTTHQHNTDQAGDRWPRYR